MIDTASAETTLSRYADLLKALLGQCIAIRHGLTLLSGPIPSKRDTALDGHLRLTGKYLADIALTLQSLPAPAARILASPTPVPFDNALPARTEIDEVLDWLATWLLARLPQWPDHARRLAVTTARLFEEGDALRPEARHQRPLGRGFEALFEERLRHRFALLPGRLGHLLALRRHLRALMEEPDHAIAQMRHGLGISLTEEDLHWIDLERRVAMLRFVRRSKTEDGHIRWFLRKDEQHGVILDRFGVRGHWIVCGSGSQTDLAKLGTAVERIVSDTAARHHTGWRVVTVRDPHHPTNAMPAMTVDAMYVVRAGLLANHDPGVLRSEIRQTIAFAGPAETAAVSAALSASHWRAATNTTSRAQPHFALRTDDLGLSLVDLTASGQSPYSVAHLRDDASDDEIRSFLDTVECVADLAIPVDEINTGSGNPHVEWARSLLRICHERKQKAAKRKSLSGLALRLVYVPSEIEHELGGVPLIGLEFLRDRMEQLGARVHLQTMRRADFRRRCPELLGADAIGVGVYIHNVEEVRVLVTMLREAGYSGKIVLGGPQLRDIDQIQSTFEGWDALVRGEAEDVLPQVLETLDVLDAGDWAKALAMAHRFAGVAIRHGDAVILCDTAARNRAATIRCPLPFQWMRNKARRRLQMNFTRGCPYLCTFCPNHQGQLYRAGPVDELWRYTTLAVADDIVLPPAIENAIIMRLHEYLGIAVAAEGKLAVALHLLLDARCTGTQLLSLCKPITALVDPLVATDPKHLQALVGMSQTLEDQRALLGSGELTPWQIKETWLIAKLAFLATSKKRNAQGSLTEPAYTESHAGQPFVLITSEDNTLVNRPTIREYLKRRIQYGLHKNFVFNPGQNTVWDLTDGNGNVDDLYIADLVRENPFVVALGVDGPSNAVIRQNRKPRYGVRDVVAVNRSLARQGVRVANNYIMLTPETDLLEAIEAFALFLLLPLSWRDYGQSINLRVIKEEATLAHDEGLVFSPDDTGHDEPMRFLAVESLLDRWSLTSRVSSRDIRPLLWRILSEDTEAVSLLPLVVDRWLRDFESDHELTAVGRMIQSQRRPDVPLVETFRSVAEHQIANFPVEAPKF